MGVYILDLGQIADILEDLKLEEYFEGDFTEEELIEGVKEYIKRLRKQGASIPKK